MISINNLQKKFGEKLAVNIDALIAQMHKDREKTARILL